jgi:hypothetical protein
VKIEWLNDEMTEAIVTVGWFRKRQARVRIEHNVYSADSWHHVTTGNGLSDAQRRVLNRTRESVFRDRAAAKEWQPVRSLPPARVVSK